MKASETVAHSSSTGEAEHTSAQSDVGGAPHASARRRRSSARLVPPQAVLRTPQPAVGSLLSPPQAELRARLSPPQAKLPARLAARRRRSSARLSPQQRSSARPQLARHRRSSACLSTPQAELCVPQPTTGGAQHASPAGGFRAGARRRRRSVCNAARREAGLSFRARARCTR